MKELTVIIILYSFHFSSFTWKSCFCIDAKQFQVDFILIKFLLPCTNQLNTFIKRIEAIKLELLHFPTIKFINLLVSELISLSSIALKKLSLSLLNTTHPSILWIPGPFYLFVLSIYLSVIYLSGERQDSWHMLMLSLELSNRINTVEKCLSILNAISAEHFLCIGFYCFQMILI